MRCIFSSLVWYLILWITDLTDLISILVCILLNTCIGTSMLDAILQNIFVGCQVDFMEFLWILKKIYSMGSWEFLEICVLGLMPPHPSPYPPTKNPKISLPIAYDYPPRATLEALAESSMETPLGRTESLCIAFPRASLDYPTCSSIACLLERLWRSYADELRCVLLGTSQ